MANKIQVEITSTDSRNRNEILQDLFNNWMLNKGNSSIEVVVKNVKGA